MKRLLYPLMFIMSIVPDSEKHLQMFNTVAQVTHSSIKSMKEGMDNFHSTMVQVSQAIKQEREQQGKAGDTWAEPQADAGAESSAGEGMDMPSILLPDQEA